MASPAIWDDFDNFCHSYLPKQTIPKLRTFAEIIHRNAGINLYLKSAERKSDLVDKVKNAFVTMRKTNMAQMYITVRRECEKVAAGSGRSAPQVAAPTPTFGGVPSAYNAAHRAGASAGSAFSARGSTPAWQQQASSSTSHKQRQAVMADWRPSPMWKCDRALTTMEQLPDIQPNESSHTRREKRIAFVMPEDVLQLLNKSKADPKSRPQYSVRLFCTSSEHFRPQGMAGQPGIPPPSNRNVPIEYPNNPDVVVDDHLVPFKERGLRGKAGSAPPLDLDKGSRGLSRIPGRSTIVIMGHQGPTVTKNKNISKKFWFQVVFCEITTMEDLLAELEQLAPTDAAAELEKIRKRAEDEDDIQVGPSPLSLKDPLSGMRITKPIRSSKCSHLQCFDARWWLESNRSHPQWHCPHCNKELKFGDIICDGYFLSILRMVPDSYDEVTLESNGEWHTTDNKFHSSGWVPPVTSVPVTAVSTPGLSAKRERSPTPDASAGGKRRAIEVLSDSSDEDEPRSNGTNGHHARSAQASTAPPGSRASSSLGVTPAVIDLTLSSDEEDDIPRPRQQSSSRPSSADTRHSETNAVNGLKRAMEQLARVQPHHPMLNAVKPSSPLATSHPRPETPSRSAAFSAQLLAGLDQVASGSTSNARGSHHSGSSIPPHGASSSPTASYTPSHQNTSRPAPVPVSHTNTSLSQVRPAIHSQAARPMVNGPSLRLTYNRSGTASPVHTASRPITPQPPTHVPAGPQPTPPQGYAPRPPQTTLPPRPTIAPPRHPTDVQHYRPNGNQ